MSKVAPSKLNEAKVEEEDEDESSAKGSEGPTLRKQFVEFVRFKNPANPGTHILLSQSDVWMKQAGVIKGRQLTTTDTGVCYFKFKKYKLSYDEYMEFLNYLADYKNIGVDEIIEKMVNCGPPPQEASVPAPAIPRP